MKGDRGEVAHLSQGSRMLDFITVITDPPSAEYLPRFLGPVNE